jgi:redox-sensitive bicupin YhaK (pirin superfamily)
MALDPTRKTYVHVVRGEVDVNGQKLAAGDAARLQEEGKLTLANGKSAEVLVFDLAPR